MNRSLTSALLVVAALSLAGCDQAPKKTETAQTKFDTPMVAISAAYERKDYATVLKLSRQLVEKGINGLISYTS